MDEVGGGIDEAARADGGEERGVAGAGVQIVEEERCLAKPDDVRAQFAGGLA